LFHQLPRLLTLSLTFFVLVGCASAPSQRTTLKQNYDRTAQYHMPDRNPIIVIPGILGSRLVDDDSGQTVWGAFRAEYADPDTDEGTRLIALPLLKSLTDNIGHVRPDGVLENLELNLIGFPIKVQAYAGILATLGAGGYRDETLGLNSVDYGTEHFTCFQFDYDWRRDITYNSQALKKFIDEKRLDVQKHYEKNYGIINADVKFDIAAHSMGGVLTRYFLRYGATPLPEDGSPPELTWAGAQDVERAILVAPPNAGSLEAFEQLLKGFNTGRPLLPHYDQAILGTFPSVYQILPRSRHKTIVWDGDIENPIDDILDPAIWQKHHWGLSGTDAETQLILDRLLPDTDSAAERAILASQFQADALAGAKQFHAALDRPASPPQGLEIFLIAGDATETPEIMSVDSQTGEVSVLKYGVGDKTVLRSSALLDERVGGEWSPTLNSPIEWRSVLFLPSEHRKITSDPVFEDNVLYWLLEAPRTKLREQ
jgi:hypothetical protein